VAHMGTARNECPLERFELIQFLMVLLTYFDPNKALILDNVEAAQASHKAPPGWCQTDPPLLEGIFWA